MSEELLWELVPDRAIALAEKCSGAAETIRAAAQKLPQEGLLGLDYNPTTRQIRVNVGDWMEPEHEDAWEAAMTALDLGDVEIADEAGRAPAGYVKIAQRSPTAIELEKEAYSSSLRNLAEILGYAPGTIPGAPNPLLATLSSGLLGAGLGYGGGWIADQVLPEDWQKGRLPAVGAAAGAGLGALPGAAWMFTNWKTGRPLFSGDLLNAPRMKQAFLNQGGYNPIDVAAFNRTVWEDPYVAPQLNLPTRAAASGLVTGAGHLGRTRYVTPMDMARMTAGMGTGYLSGALVGKALGLLMGMPEETQNTLKRTGMMAGLINNLVPMAFQ